MGGEPRERASTEELGPHTHAPKEPHAGGRPAAALAAHGDDEIGAAHLGDTSGELHFGEVQRADDMAGREFLGGPYVDHHHPATGRAQAIQLVNLDRLVVAHRVLRSVIRTSTTTPAPNVTAATSHTAASSPSASATNPATNAPIA